MSIESSRALLSQQTTRDDAFPANTNTECVAPSFCLSVCSFFLFFIVLFDFELHSLIARLSSKRRIAWLVRVKNNKAI